MKLLYFCRAFLLSMVKTKWYKQALAIALLTLFTAYYVNVSFFYHCHTINGVALVHSHAHDKNHPATETTDTEVTLISTLSLFQTFAAALFFIGTVVFAIREIIFSNPSIGRLSAQLISCVCLRAPPAAN